ncbi:MAG: hypothetical protein ACTH1Z_01365 [Ancrocorticia sp.]|uniref:hypothetical protein n=1 Tax=Ancrocorticia sp. TaxID=2593684 RepID=UPI003F9123E1
MTTIVGGTTQSIDPTRWDYVPPSDETAEGVEPLDANGGEPIGGFTINVNGVPIGIPKMILRHNIKGTKLKVNTEEARIETTGATVCNYRFDFQNRYGKKIYKTNSTGVYSKCTINSGWVKNSYAPFTAKRGVQCVRLFSNGVFVGEQCHSIVP